MARLWFLLCLLCIVIMNDVQGNVSAPDKVTNITFNVNGTDIIINWLLPVPHPGPSEYFVFVEDAVKVAESHDLCDKPWLAPSTVNCSTNVTDGQTNNASCNVIVSKWFWAYKVHILASTLGGNPTYTSPEKLISGRKAPGPVQELQVDYNIDSVCNGRVPNSVRQVCVKWNDVCPTERNDFIVSFSLIKTEAYLTNGDTSIIPVHSRLLDDVAKYRKRNHLDDKMSYEVIVDVQLYVNYTVTVFANGKIYEGEREEIAIYAKAITPRLPQPDELRLSTTQFKSEVDMVEFALIDTFFFFVSKYGDVIHRGFIVNRNRHQDIKARYKTFETFPIWRERDSTGSYAVNESKERGLIILGDGDCSQSEKLCDGPLDSDTDYEIWVYICTRAGCASELIIPRIRTLAQEPNNAGYIIVTVICAYIVLASVIAVFVYVCSIRKKRVVQAVINAPVRAFRKSHLTGPIPLDIPESVIYDDCLALREEFRQIEEMSTIRDHGACMLDTNRHKNRFADIVPCQDS